MSLAGLVRVYDRWPTWVGDRTDFERVLSRFDELVIGAPESSAPSDATCTADQRGERQGEWHELLQEVDTAKVSGFTIAAAGEAMPPQVNVRLAFSRKHGVVLTANPAGAQLLRDSDDSLLSAIESGVTRAAWLWTELCGAIFGVMVACIVEVAALLLISDDSIVIVAALPVGFMLAWGIRALLIRRYPRFRIRKRST